MLFIGIIKISAYLHNTRLNTANIKWDRKGALSYIHSSVESQVRVGSGIGIDGSINIQFIQFN